MASSNIKDWQMVGFPGIFEKVILIVAHGSIRDLDNCRLVCKTWNVMIMNKFWDMTK